MNLQSLRSFFLWCTLLNGALLIISALFCALAGDWIFSVQSHFFPVSRDAYNVAIYSFIGLFKIFFLMFNLVPYLALLIMGARPGAKG